MKAVEIQQYNEPYPNRFCVPGLARKHFADVISDISILVFETCREEDL
jgi:hypothetical protein